jgi:hypothetical protein
MLSCFHAFCFQSKAKHDCVTVVQLPSMFWIRGCENVCVFNTHHALRNIGWALHGLGVLVTASPTQGMMVVLIRIVSHRVLDRHRVEHHLSLCDTTYSNKCPTWIEDPFPFIHALYMTMIRSCHILWNAPFVEWAHALFPCLFQQNNTSPEAWVYALDVPHSIAKGLSLVIIHVYAQCTYPENSNPTRSVVVTVTV